MYQNIKNYILDNEYLLSNIQVQQNLVLLEDIPKQIQYMRSQLQCNLNQSKQNFQHMQKTNNNKPLQIQQQIFNYLDISFYQVHNIQINESQHIHTVFIPKQGKLNQKKKIFYLSHGFGGSSLMYFPILNDLKQQGSIVLWQIRGMGLCKKQKSFKSKQKQIHQLQQYFLLGIQKVLSYYSHQNITMILHSFSTYIVLLYLIKNKFQNTNINNMILLSPVGITPKQQDYKNQIKGLKDVYHTVISKIGWRYKLTYKSFLRKLCCCPKAILKHNFKQINIDQQGKQLMAQLFYTLVNLPDGSEDLFFQFFHPRVLPKKSIKPIFNIPKHSNVKIMCFFGGKKDWADRKGMNQLKKMFPQQVQINQIENCGHMFPFEINAMKNILNKISFF